MKRLLAVSWEMPPMYGPRATQVARTLGQLAAFGWQSTVVTMAPRCGGPHWPDGQTAVAPSGVEYVRVPSPEEWLPMRVAGRLAPLLRRIPDPQRVWVGRASRATSRVAAAGDFSGLISFAQPWSNHLVAQHVHRRAGLAWVAHFSDPWVDSPYTRGPHWLRSVLARMEADVIRNASAIVFVTEETADLVMRKYPEALRSKVAIVPHGFNRPSHRVTAPTPERRKAMRMVHTGRFYSDIRTPLPLLRALASLKAREALAEVIEVIFVGPHNEEFKREAVALGLEGIVEFHGRVSPAEAAAIAADADVLLLIDAPSDGPSVFLPSKLIDYLPLRKPIFGVTPREGASAALLRRLECPVAPPDRVDEVAVSIAGLIREWRSGELSVSSSFDRVAAEYDIERTTARLHEVLSHAFGR
jgi:glycosyltransferase involved in cell wall biosynthesis